ncbi:agamous-like MADS-box protein AGL82 [Telopea speciosissima]|uniref:agamous-like MADS-box protein AGL82 n=1 Tax=Telopea speciosissima TaxID=54955 RepID=UPI001CC39CD3|nr:agamous-like MADS-box protein AGL82 [Telopea speciosissima]
MELISNERARRTTFQKRVKGLKKKIREFSILCDVKACAIIFGPKQGNSYRLVEPEIWPENQTEVCEILKEFQKHDMNERGKREEGIADFFIHKTKNVKAELDRLRRKKDKADQYPTWDERLDHYSLDQLKTLSTELDLKVELVNQKLNRTEEEEFDLLEKAIEYFSSPPDDDVLLLHQQLPLSYVPNPMMMDEYSCLPIDFTYGSPAMLFDTGTLMMDGVDFTYGTPVISSVAQIHDQKNYSYLLPTLDENQIEGVFNNSSQGGGGGYYYIPAVADIQ